MHLAPHSGCASTIDGIFQLGVRPGKVTLAEEFDRVFRRNPVVTSAGSHAHDQSWDLSHDTSRRVSSNELRIDFTMSPIRGFGGTSKAWLPEPKTLGDYPALFSLAKRLFTAVRLVPRNYRGTPYKIATVCNLWFGFRVLVEALIAHHYSDISELDQDTARRIVAKRKSLPMCRAIHLIGTYADLLGVKLQFDIPDVTAAIRRKFARSAAKTRPIPDNELTAIVTHALKWLDRSNYILTLYDNVIAYKELYEANLLNCWGAADDRHFASYEVFWENPYRSTKEMAAIPPRKKRLNIEKVRLNARASADGFSIKDTFSLQRAAAQLQISAVVLVFALTGMRLSEIAGMTDDSLIEERDGSIIYQLIRSTHTKYSDRHMGDSALWLCGSVGASAFQVLKRLSCKFRQITGDRYVVTAMSFGYGCLWGKTLKRRWAAARGDHYLKKLMSDCGYGNKGSYREFLKTCFVAAGLESSLLPHPHQYRRTFARWAARCDRQTSLLGLQDHFKHVSYFMTRFYAGFDDEMLLWFEAERTDNCVEDFDKILRAQAIAGIGGKAMKREIDDAIARGELPKEFRGAVCRGKRFKLIQNWIASGIIPRVCSGHLCVPRDPAFDCSTQGGGFGCNQGECVNRVCLPEHAQALKLEVDNYKLTLEWYMRVGIGDTPYAKNLRKLILAEEGDLRRITI